MPMTLSTMLANQRIARPLGAAALVSTWWLPVAMDLVVGAGSAAATDAWVVMVSPPPV
ncbi:hypothetical protein GCM10027427_29750 [Pseudoclavibacter terrae]